MNPSRTLSPFAFAGVFSLLLLSATQGYGQTTATTDPVGYCQIGAYDSSGNYQGLLGNSDTFISLPFTRPPSYVGTVSSVGAATVSGNITSNVVTVSGSPGWNVNQFVYAPAVPQTNHYYVLFGTDSTSNPKKGRIYPVSANTANTLTLTSNNDDLSGVPANAQVVLIAYWSLNTIFPATDASPSSTASYTPTTSTRSFKTQILIPDYANTGYNLAYSQVYFYSNNVNSSTGNVGWRVVGDNTTDHGDDIFLPDGYVVVRNNNGAATLPLTVSGSVATKALSVPLYSGASSAQPQDNAVSITRPVPLTLDTLGLNPPDTASTDSFVATTSTRSYKDQLFIYDNSQVAINKSPSAIYFYGYNVNSSTANGIGWRVIGDNATPHGSDPIAYGSALTIRKAYNGTGTPVYWTNTPTY